ncbi:MAG: gamma-glutamyl-gamma-aminobutyrate hydrolase family protein [Planctomycetes bacterium]|nr:gamma-glutamyl-gamma-aminobutyrate hydrolase family protein [Planctomycetota bacterium]
MSATVILVCSGDPTPPVQAAVGRYALWFQRAAPAVVFGFADLREPDAELPAADAYVFMGSPNAVYDPHPWRPRALEAARQALDSGAPALGVCFGHQLFCEALGGRVARNERVEVGTIEVALDPAAAADPLLTPFAGTLRVNASHDDTVVELPASARPQILGTSSRDRHQVLRWGERAWSVQFHPEMRARETALSIRWRAPRLEAEGEDPAEVLARLDDGLDGRRLLHRFLHLAGVPGAEQE